MGMFSFGSKKVDLPWTKIIAVDQLDELFEKDGRAKLVFKHSTRCSISSMALSRFEKEWPENTACDLFFLDLIAYRQLSDSIAQRCGVIHQSPQVIVMLNGELVHHNSHNGISAGQIAQLISSKA
jgi:bacillithiol system protein YtxJ